MNDPWLRSGVVRRRSGRRTASVLASLMVLLASCAGEPVDASPPDVRPTGPLTDLEPCGASSDPGPDPVPATLPAPESLVATTVQDLGQITNVIGELAMTPSQARRWYDAMDGFQTITVEDETYDAEILVTDGTTRIYVKFVARCATGSGFAAVLSPEEMHLPPATSP